MDSKAGESASGREDTAAKSRKVQLGRVQMHVGRAALSFCLFFATIQTIQTGKTGGTG